MAENRHTDGAGTGTDGPVLKPEKKQTGQNLREIRVGFVGNPNCGKTTLFNAFTGANLKVANWPGCDSRACGGAHQL